METLSHHDILALNRAIGEIYDARDLESFYRAAFNAIHGIIPCELCSCNDVSLHPIRVLSLITSSPEHDTLSNKFLPALNAHVQEHPLFPHCFSRKVVKTTDYASRNQFKATALHAEYYRHLEIETQIWFSLPVSQENVALFALSRKSSRDFSERDRLILTLLKPHLAGSLRNVRELGSIRIERDLLQRGAEAENQGVILCQADGMVSCLSGIAREMLQKYFDAYLAEETSLPESLWGWFKTEALPHINGRGSEAARRVEREPLTLEKDGDCLTIKLVNDCTTGDYILLMIETDPFPQLNLQKYGLTSRETEVLHWLSRGKTNGEIATILGMSRRTAEKHLEHIFAKLGVETRGAAAAVIRKA